METLSRTPANLAGLDPNSSPTHRTSEKPWFADTAVSWSAIVAGAAAAAALSLILLIWAPASDWRQFRRGPVKESAQARLA